MAGLMLAASVLGQALAPSDIAQAIKTSIAQHSDVHVDSVHTTPVPGIFEVVADADVFYTDASGRYAFLEARLVDMQDKRDLTDARLRDMNRIPFESLPLQLAIKEVRGDGSRTFAVFEDSQCPICQVFTKFIDQLDDVTIYRFPFPVIHPTESARQARIGWCAPDRAGTWHAIMNGVRPEGTESCDVSGLVDILKVGEQHAINSTPTVVLLDGTRLVGATPPEQFIEAIDQSRRQ
ncbi:DsbC family protein [Corticibacter populi]|uniref:Thiol:disulfide interchange protein n=2 Tax=Corticibacter populi TaxID=1550736 RepID=A0A3M6R0T1_9BURK|nr:DsbC family protein [Corticibacter populi]